MDSHVAPHAPPVRLSEQINGLHEANIGMQSRLDKFLNRTECERNLYGGWFCGCLGAEFLPSPVRPCNIC